MWCFLFFPFLKIYSIYGAIKQQGMLSDIPFLWLTHNCCVDMQCVLKFPLSSLFYVLVFLSKTWKTKMLSYANPNSFQTDRWPCCLFNITCRQWHCQFSTHINSFFTTFSIKHLTTNAYTVATHISPTPAFFFEDLAWTTCCCCFMFRRVLAHVLIRSAFIFAQGGKWMCSFASILAVISPRLLCVSGGLWWGVWPSVITQTPTLLHIWCCLCVNCTLWGFW